MSKDFENNNNGEPNNFGLPEGYFQSSANSIFNKIEWVEEHKVYPRLASLKKESGFTVPENYFEQLQTQLELIEFPNLQKLKKESGFTVPQNYFESLEENELAKVLTDDTHELQGLDLLSALERKNPFEVSEGYFENSAQRITSQVTSSNPEAKIVRLFPAKFWYSAAAAVLVLTLGIWIYNQYFKPAVVGDCGTLACVDKKELVKTKALESLDSDELYELVDTKKLEEKLETPAQNNKDEKEKNKKQDDSTMKGLDPEDVLDEIE